MSKTFVLALFLGAIVPSEAKIRPLYPTLEGTQNALVKSHERKVRSPLVQKCSHAVQGSKNEPVVGAGSCQAQCLFQDDQNEWCFATTSPMLTTGWNWSQNTGTDFWQIKFQPYLNTQIFIDS